MSKKKARHRLKLNKKQKPESTRRHNRRTLMVIGLILCLGLTSLILAVWKRMRNPLNPLVAVPTTTPTPQLTKEYIYAGGKLIATEEPRLSSILFAPSSLIATGTSSPQVNLTWTAATGATVDHYQVERMDSLASGYSIIAQSVTSTTYPDTAVTVNKAYLYRVRAFDSSNNYTNYTNVDLATTVTFDNDPLVTYAEDPNNATVIRAVHFTQLRDAVNAVRRLVDANAAEFQWTSTNNPPPPQVGGQIYASHLTDLRTNLAAALSALSLPAVNYQHLTITPQVSLVYKVDIQELRDAVK
jgi:hypothetical protein